MGAVNSCIDQEASIVQLSTGSLCHFQMEVDL